MPDFNTILGILLTLAVVAMLVYLAFFGGMDKTRRNRRRRDRQT